MTRRLAAGIAALLALAIPSAASAQVSESDVREVLETSQVRDVLGSVGDQILVGARSAAPDVDTLKLAPIVHTYFAEDSLVAAAARHLAAAASTDLVLELRAWLLSDSIQTLEERADSSSEAESLEQFAQRIQTSRPPVERIQLAVRFTKIQRAGDFYVRYLTELQAASDAIAAAVLKTSSESRQPSSAQTAQAVQQFDQVATLSFLQRFETLTDAEVQRLIAAYESRSGMWYISAYTDAVTFAISDAARKALAALN